MVTSKHAVELLNTLSQLPLRLIGHSDQPDNFTPTFHWFPGMICRPSADWHIRDLYQQR
jgi:hypothetical protein